MNDYSNEMTLPSLLKRGLFALEDNDYKTAQHFFDQALNIDPESCAAYIGLAKAKSRITEDKEFFQYCVEQYHKDNTILKRARQFADAEWKVFFERVDVEIQEIEKKNEAKKRKKAVGLIAIGIAFIVGIILILPHIRLSSAERLYKSGQYKQAYERAVQISNTSSGNTYAKKLKKYAYAYLCDYISQNGSLQIQAANNATIKVFSTGYNHPIYFSYDIKTEKSRFLWMAEMYEYMDKASCFFYEFEYIQSQQQSNYSQCGEFVKADYQNSQAIKLTKVWGSQHFLSGSPLYDYCNETMSKAFSLIQNKLGIPAEHLGFYSYQQ